MPNLADQPTVENAYRRSVPGYLAALGSAVLVGLFTVLNKWLLNEGVPPLSAGAWTYFAAGLALLPWAVWHKGLEFKRPWIMAGWLVAGSIIGPCFYFWGLKLTSGSQGVLLINLEAVFTAFLAFAIFREPMSLTTFAAGAAVVAGGVWVSWPNSGDKLVADHTLGNFLIALGYLGWATENNLGRLLGEAIPAVTLVCIKAIAAAVVMAALATAFQQSLLVDWHVVPGIFASGAVALGMSLALFYMAMRLIGAGRTGLISSTSTLWGIIAAFLLLHESLDRNVLAGGSLMLLGLVAFAWDTSKMKLKT